MGNHLFSLSTSETVYYDVFEVTHLYIQGREPLFHVGERM